MSQETRLTLTASPEGARAAALRVRDILTGVPAADAMACELAVAEAANNVVVHDTAADVFTVVVRAGGGRFSAAVCHRGRGASPNEIVMPDPEAESGRGLALIASCMERVRFVRTHGESRVLMTRRLPRTRTAAPTTQRTHQENR
jgi:anti-sigma regulatory factor (Ser/Thr protein kinase)